MNEETRTLIQNEVRREERLQELELELADSLQSEHNELVAGIKQRERRIEALKESLA